MESKPSSGSGVQLIYAVGDIHGRFDLLKRAVGKILRHANRRSYKLVFLGDYIDRGSDSSKVVELLMELERRAGAICLRGNHEQLLLDCHQTGDAKEFRLWMQIGGAATLISYGVKDLTPEAIGRLPHKHLDWLSRRPLLHLTDRQIFVHAGVEPGVPVAEQRAEDMLWIRERFLRSPPERFVDERHIVHGHTPVWEGKPEGAIPELLVHRTNLDTGAYLSGVLSVGVFTSDRPGPVDLLPIT